MLYVTDGLRTGGSIAQSDFQATSKLMRSLRANKKGRPFGLPFLLLRMLVDQGHVPLLIVPDAPTGVPSPDVIELRAETKATPV